MAAIDSGKSAQPPTPHRPIDTLFPCLAVVLGETGKFFRNPALHDPKHLNYTKGKLNKLITGANQEFQDALDEIEIQILDAKAVMERDLAIIRTKRAERERAAAGLKTPSPSHAKQKATLANGEVDTMHFEPAENLHQEQENRVTEDAIMTNGQPDPETQEVIGMGIGENELSTHDGNENLAAFMMGTGVENAEGSLETAEATEEAKTETKPDQTAFDATTQPEQTSGTPTMPDFQDVNFESMFNDNGTADDNDQMDFELDFGNNTNTAEDFLNDSAFDNITMSNEEVKNLNTSNEDINTLLPGLESYVNAGGDFSLTDVPASNPAVLPEVASKSEMTNPAVTAPVEQAPIESNFDDFFASGNYMDEGGDDDLGGDGGFGDFDDAWFATDLNKTDT